MWLAWPSDPDSEYSTAVCSPWWNCIPVQISVREKQHLYALLCMYMCKSNSYFTPRRICFSFRGVVLRRSHSLGGGRGPSLKARGLALQFTNGGRGAKDPPPPSQLPPLKTRDLAIYYSSPSVDLIYYTHTIIFTKVCQQSSGCYKLFTIIMSRADRKQSISLS